MAEVKVLIGEIDGVELSYQQERLLAADDVKFFTSSASGFTADNVQDAIVEAAGVIGDLECTDIVNTTPITLTTSWQDVPLNFERVKDSIFTHVSNSAEITVTETSRYLVTYNAGVQTTSGGTRTQTAARLVLNGSPLANSTSEMYNRTSGQGGDNASRSFILDLSSGDTLKLQVEIQSGANTQKTIAGESGIVITRLIARKGDKGDTGSGSNITVENNNTPVGSPFDTVNFEGAGLSTTDDGGGQVTVDYSPDASEIPYDNSSSGLTATDVQNAIDEVEDRVETNESDILQNATDISNHINDPVDAHDASAISFSSTSSLSSTDVQNAIEEADILTIQKDDSNIQVNTDIINFENLLEVTDEGGKKVTVNAKATFLPQYQFVGQMNFDQYLYSWQHDGNGSRRSGDPSNGWQFTNSSPIVCPFNGVVKSAVFRNRGVAQSTGTPDANMTLLYELWNVGVTGGEGTKLGDISVTFTTAGKTIGNFWNSAVNTNLNEINNFLNISVNQGDLLGLKFIRQTGASNVVSVHNALVSLYIEETL